MSTAGEQWTPILPSIDDSRLRPSNQGQRIQLSRFPRRLVEEETPPRESSTDIQSSTVRLAIFGEQAAAKRDDWLQGTFAARLTCSTKGGHSASHGSPGKPRPGHQPLEKARVLMFH